MDIRRGAGIGCRLDGGEDEVEDVDEKEFRRVMAIAEGHARTALAKPETQRESFLAYCRNNWKRYAASITRSEAERERFADELDRATREMIALAEASATTLDKWSSSSDWPESVEGATDSVLTHEAAYEPPAPPPPPEGEGETAGNEAETAGAVDPDQPAEVDTEAQRAAEEEDRVTARYGFGGNDAAAEPATNEPPEHAEELRRKVQEVLRARQQDKADDNG